MNRLRPEKQEVALRCLVDGASIRASERIVGAHRDTIMRLMVRVGEYCQQIMSENLPGLNCRHVQLDEIWNFVRKKQRRLTAEDNPNEAGDFGTFTAVDTDTRLVPCFMVGKRDLGTTKAFIRDLASRLTNRVLLSSDAMSAYVEAIDSAFGTNVDYGQILKSYEAEPVGPGRYSPPRVIRTKKTPRLGNPDQSQISTSYVERHNLLIRMSLRRFTRLTDGFSKKPENLRAAVGLFMFYYNYMRPHRALHGATPAMAAGVTNSFVTWKEVIDR